MSKFIAFALYDSAGAPYSGASPSFSVYCDASGSPLTPPTINNRGGGVYDFTITDTDVAFLISTGSNPAYLSGTDGDRVQAFALYDSSTGLPSAGHSPAFATYDDHTGSPLTPPAISDFGSGLYGFSPTPGDFAAGVSFEINSGSSVNPKRLSGYAQASGSAPGTPAVGSISPTPDSVIGPSTPITFTLTDTVSIVAALVLAKFPQSGLYEVVHDGSAFSSNYAAGSTRSPISGGWSYSVVRTGGWPSSPTIVPVAVDAGGGENP